MFENPLMIAGGIAQIPLKDKGWTS